MSSVNEDSAFSDSSTIQPLNPSPFFSKKNKKIASTYSHFVHLFFPLPSHLCALKEITLGKKLQQQKYSEKPNLRLPSLIYINLNRKRNKMKKRSQTAGERRFECGPQHPPAVTTNVSTQFVPLEKFSPSSERQLRMMNMDRLMLKDHTFFCHYTVVFGCL